MFEANIYKERRRQLKSKLDPGIILLLGNKDSAINMSGNVYPFKQDSNFLYFFGPDIPVLAGVINLETGEEIIFGHEPCMDDFIYKGVVPDLEQIRQYTGADQAMELDRLGLMLQKAVHQGKKIHFLPPYRGETKLQLYQLLGINPLEVDHHVSIELIREVVRLREIKSPEEITQIESAINLTGRMLLSNMLNIKSGDSEKHAASRARQVAEAQTSTAFPIILTTKGQYLHVLPDSSKMKNGQLLIQDCGAESQLHYASDITRTFPISRTFTSLQREIYEIVLAAQNLAFSLISPGIEFSTVHRQVGLNLCRALKDMAIMKGNPIEAEAAGAHALFFPCGLGHAMGLDVHDMESLGEDHVGYTGDIKRSRQFGLNRLRLAKALKPGMVLTVEPGIYFIPELIAQWRKNSLHSAFINYEALDRYQNFGGIRLEDDVVVTGEGCRILGQPIPRTIDEIETIMS